MKQEAETWKDMYVLVSFLNYSVKYKLSEINKCPQFKTPSIYSDNNLVETPNFYLDQVYYKVKLQAEKITNL